MYPKTTFIVLLCTTQFIWPKKWMCTNSTVNAFSQLTESTERETMHSALNACASMALIDLDPSLPLIRCSYLKSRF